MIQRFKRQSIDMITRVFNIDADYFVRGSFWQTLSQITGTLIGIGTSVAFANLLPKETYGTYTYVISLFSLLSIFALNGMDAAIIQSVARGLEGSVLHGMFARMRWGFLGSLVGMAIGTYYWTTGNAPLAYAVFFGSLFVPLLDSFAVFYDVLRGRKQFDADAKFSIIAQVVTAGAIVATLYVSKSLLTILAAYFFSYTLCHAFLLWYMLRRYPLNSAESPDMLGYGKFMTFIRGITSAAAYLDKIILFNFVSPTDVAIYSIAIAPVKKIEGLLGTIPTLALPRFAEYPKEAVKKELLKKVAKFSLVVGIVIIAYVLSIKFLFLLLFPKYLESVWYSQLYALTLIGFPLSLVYTYFQSQALTNIILPYKITIHALQIALLAVCIYFYGLIGAIIARILGQIVGIPLIFFFFRKS